MIKVVVQPQEDQKIADGFTGEVIFIIPPHMPIPIPLAEIFFGIKVDKKDEKSVQLMELKRVGVPLTRIVIQRDEPLRAYYILPDKVFNQMCKLVDPVSQDDARQMVKRYWAITLHVWSPSDSNSFFTEYVDGEDPFDYLERIRKTSVDKTFSMITYTQLHYREFMKLTGQSEVLPDGVKDTADQKQALEDNKAIEISKANADSEQS